MSQKTPTTTVDLKAEDPRWPEPPFLRASIVIYGPGKPQVAHLWPPRDLLVVGRVPPAQILVADASISRQHACFRWAGGRLSVEDLRSRNGTWIAGKRVEQCRLSSGQELLLGGVRAVVAIMGAAPEAHAPAEVTVPGAEDLVVLHPKTRAVYEQAAKFAGHDAPVLILGETGTGKEHVAQWLHDKGPRRSKPFKVLNCGGIPAGLTESILFGHERGSFTGAFRRAPGLFEQAHQGVLFLDELGELPLSAQASLLRAVETKTVTRIGSHQEIPADVRVVAATHRNLAAMAAQGAFREDLLYRLNAITLELPPLRERRDEIKPLTELFARRACGGWNRSVFGFEPDVFEKLESYHWPGNIRQLRNAVEHCVLVCQGDTVRLDDLPAFIFERACSLPWSDPRRMSNLRSTSPVCANQAPEPSLRDHLRRCERDLVCLAMHKTEGNITAAARLLGIPRRTLSNKLQALGLTQMNWTPGDP